MEEAIARRLRDLKTHEFGSLLKASEEDDLDKRDIHVPMRDVTFIAKDIQTDDPRDPDKKILSLMPRLSVPGKYTPTRKRVVYEFSMSAFSQFSKSQLGMPPNYILKCPAKLAHENVTYWQSVFVEKDLLLRARHPEKGSPYLRAVLPASYGVFDNTALLRTVTETARQADFKIYNWDIQDDAMHARFVLPQYVNMGTQQTRDDVHLGFHLSNSETGHRPIMMDIMTFRLVCVNGMIALVNGERLVRQNHSGDIDSRNLMSYIRTKTEETIKRQDTYFGKMVATRDRKPDDVFEEVRLVCDRFKIKGEHREIIYQLLTEVYTGGTQWDIVNAITRTARELQDDANARTKLEEIAGTYVMEGDLLQTA
jgi:hypothetical protein